MDSFGKYMTADDWVSLGSELFYAHLARVLK